MAICNCEHIIHFPEDSPGTEWHPYMAEHSEQELNCIWIGNVCKSCGFTHMKEFLEDIGSLVL